MEQPKKRKFKAVWLGYVAVVLLFLGGGAWLISLFLAGGEIRPQRQIRMVALVKPPPPPPEQPPEPPPPEEEKIVEPEPEPEPSEQPSEEPPAGEDLGIDAEGSGDGDAFGLKGKPGGRSLLAGDGGGSLLRKYQWYTSALEQEIGREVRRRLEADGGLPDGKPKATVRIVLDAQGRITEYRILTASGNSRMDQILKQTLGGIQLKEPPPEGMPRTVNIAIRIGSAARG